MNVKTIPLSALAQKIMKLLSNRLGLEDSFAIINKNQFDGETLDSFFAVLQELKESGLVVLKEDYKYIPYTNFGDMTTKQYAKLDIYLKLP
jgi:hypothetical protein